MNKLKVRTMRNKLLVYLAAAAIPALLIVDVVQAQRYAKLKSEVRALELKQVELVEKNKKLISDISVLSSSDRIERIAEYELGMRKANTDDIVRVEIKGSAK
ncbi:MAG: cell division protein FtsL [Treponemataceae bacterium]|nr:cell division protein FtsL [Treponemataceae bacterium]